MFSERSIKKTPGISSVLTDIGANITGRYLEPIATKEIRVEKLEIKIENLPKAFSGFTICHISDMHNVDVFESQPEIFTDVVANQPDIFIISGDSVHNNKSENSIKIIKNKLSQIVPKNRIFVATGNHEFLPETPENGQISDVRTYTKILRDAGINILRNDFCEIKKGNDSIFILGIDDPQNYINEDSYLRYQLDELLSLIPGNKTKILISHRPEKIDLYSQYNLDLVFSGHAHGGQIRIPFTNRGIIAPHQGFFPKYIDGVYRRGNIQEIVSPGLSDEIKVPRINNPGKIYMVTLTNR